MCKWKDLEIRALSNLVISHELFQLSEVAEVLLYRVKLKALTHISQWYDRQAMCMCESPLDISYFIREIENPT